ncbi:MAG: hypothetical protein ACJAYC_001807 [Halieaceae bacterium]
MDEYSIKTIKVGVKAMAEPQKNSFDNALANTHTPPLYNDWWVAA